MGIGRYYRMIKQAVAVKSSHIAAIDYSEKSKVMIITWQNGRRYEYKNVPKDLYEEILSAKSKGEFFNERIRNNSDYPFREIA